MDEIGALLSLWRDQTRPSRDVREIAAKQLERLDGQIVELRGMAGVLRHLVPACYATGGPIVQFWTISRIANFATRFESAKARRTGSASAVCQLILINVSTTLGCWQGNNARRRGVVLRTSVNFLAPR